MPPVYVFGEESAEKQRQVDALKAQLPTITEAAGKAAGKVARASSDLNEFATSRAREIKNLLVAPGGSFNNYNAADFRTDIARFEINPITKLTDEELKSLLELKDAKPLTPVPKAIVNFPDVSNFQREVREVLTKTVASSIIEELAANPSAAEWVAHGLPLHTHDGDSTTCKFCDQSLPSARLRQLEAHFNDHFREFASRLDALADRIHLAVVALDDVDIPPSSLLYPDLQAEYIRERNNVETSLKNVRLGLSALANAVKEKQSRMFQALELEDLLAGGDGNRIDDKSILVALLAALNAGMPALGEFIGKTAFSRLQKVVDKHNERTASFAEQVKAARGQLHSHELAQALPGWQGRQTKLTAARGTKEATEKKKNAIESDIKALEANILQHRQPADELNLELIAYLGHDEIQMAVEDTGYRLVRRGVFASNLSEGERTAIAFLHFLKSLDDRSFDLVNGTVVVDDPISSLDSNSIYSAFGFMKRKLSNAGQLFVLTHNFTFFREVRNWFKFANRQRPKPSRFYMLRTEVQLGERSSTVQMLDPFLRDYESEYHYLFKRILKASELPDGAALQTYYELPNLARRLLESFLVFKVPDEATLHARLEAVDFNGPKKTRLIRFLDTHSHAEQIGESHEEASALAEAPEVLRDLLSLIAHCDSGHFQRMKAAIDHP